MRAASARAGLQPVGVVRVAGHDPVLLGAAGFAVAACLADRHLPVADRAGDDHPAGAHRVVSPAPQRGGLWRHARGAEPAGQPHTGRGAGSAATMVTLHDAGAKACAGDNGDTRSSPNQGSRCDAIFSLRHGPPHGATQALLAASGRGLHGPGAGRLRLAAAQRGAGAGRAAGHDPGLPRGARLGRATQLDAGGGSGARPSGRNRRRTSRREPRRHGALRPPGPVRRRRQRRLRRGLPERLVQHRHAAGVQDRHRRVHRRADGALRLHRAGLRPGAAESSTPPPARATSSCWARPSACCGS